MGETQGTMSPFSHPAAPAFFLRGEQVQEFLELVAVAVNSPISLPAPALRRPQERCTLISQMRQKRWWMGLFSKGPICIRQGPGAACCAQHPSGWGHRCYCPKFQWGAGKGSRAVAGRAALSFTAHSPTFLCVHRYFWANPDPFEPLRC